MVVKLLARIKKKRRENNKGTLFRGDDELFKQVLSHTRVYGEYGCGQSTSWVASNTNAQVLSVDTSKTWVDKVLLSGLSSKQQLNIVHIDLGAVAEELLSNLVYGLGCVPVRLFHYLFNILELNIVDQKGQQIKSSNPLPALLRCF